MPVCQSVVGVSQQISLVVERRQGRFDNFARAELVVDAAYLVVGCRGGDIFE